MRLAAFDWDERNASHIARHNVTPEEVEEAFEGRRVIHRARDGRYILLGRSAAGRYLIVAFVVRSGSVRTITARDMTRAERKRYR